LAPLRSSRSSPSLLSKLGLPPTMKIHPVFHVSLIEPASLDRSLHPQPIPPPPIIVDNQQEYEAEEILDSRSFRHQLQYLVNGKVTTSQKVLGEPASNLKNSPSLVRSFTLSIQANQVPSRPEFHCFARFARLLHSSTSLYFDSPLRFSYLGSFASLLFLRLSLTTTSN